MGWLKNNLSILLSPFGPIYKWLIGLAIAIACGSPALGGLLLGVYKMITTPAQSLVVSVPAIYLWYAAWAGIILLIVLIALFHRIFELSYQIKGAKYKLAKLRARGVELRNDGTRGVPQSHHIYITDETSLTKWEELLLQWNEDVKAELRKFNESDAEWFSIMDTVSKIPRVEFNPFTETHLQHLNQRYIQAYLNHDERLKRLGDIVSPPGSRSQVITPQVILLKENIGDCNESG